MHTNTELILPESYKNDERKRRNVEHILEAILRAIPKIGKTGRQFLNRSF